jgi:glycosyltransferase involved in cell wall biosynthesis
MATPTINSTWVIVPAFNEELYLERFLSKLLKVTPNVIVVDDGSSDRTFEIAQAQGVWSLRHSLNLGKGAALKTGIEFAFNELQADAIIMMDGDDQHEATEINQFMAELDKGHDLVFGVRQEASNMPWLKLKINRLGSFVTYLLFGEYILDIPSGYKALTKKGYQQVAWDAVNYAVEIEIAARTAKKKLPYALVTIKTIYHDTNKGMTVLDAVSIIVHLLKLKVLL